LRFRLCRERLSQSLPAHFSILYSYAVACAILKFIVHSKFFFNLFQFITMTAAKGSAKDEGAKNGRRHGRW
jgi:uncharacterized membrane protein YwaF